MIPTGRFTLIHQLQGGGPVHAPVDIDETYSVSISGRTGILGFIFQVGDTNRVSMAMADRLMVVSYAGDLAPDAEAAPDGPIMGGRMASLDSSGRGSSGTWSLFPESVFQADLEGSVFPDRDDG